MTIKIIKLWPYQTTIWSYVSKYFNTLVWMRRFILMVMAMFYNLKVLSNSSVLTNMYHKKNQQITSTFLQSEDTLLQYVNQCRMFKFTQTQVVVTNTYAGKFAKKWWKKVCCCSSWWIRQVGNEATFLPDTTVEAFWRWFDLDKFRLHTQNQLLILDNLKSSKISVDKITQFCLIPP